MTGKIIDPETWRTPVYNPFFETEETIIDWVIDTCAEIKKVCPMGMWEMDSVILAQTVINAGNGDHLEIGSLFGGSAILSALVKKNFSLQGNIYCIDHLVLTGKDYISINARKFDVENRIIV